MPVYTNTRWILRDFINLYHRDFSREHCLTWLRDCWSSLSGGAPDFSNSNKTWAKPTTMVHIIWDRIMTWLSSSGRGVSFGGFSGEHGASERAQSAEWPKGIVSSWFWPNPEVNNIWRYSPYRIFVSVGDATQVGLVRTAFFAWAMEHRWILLPDEGSPAVAPNPVIMEFASNGVILVRKIGLVVPFRAQGRCL